MDPSYNSIQALHKKRSCQYQENRVQDTILNSQQSNAQVRTTYPTRQIKTIQTLVKYSCLSNPQSLNSEDLMFGMQMENESFQRLAISPQKFATPAMQPRLGEIGLLSEENFSRLTVENGLDDQISSSSQNRIYNSSEDMHGQSRQIIYDLINQDCQLMTTENIINISGQANQQSIGTIIINDTSLLQENTIIEIRIFNQDSHGWQRVQLSDFDLVTQEFFEKYLINDRKINLRLYIQNNRQSTLDEIQRHLQTREQQVIDLQNRLDSSQQDGSVQISQLNKIIEEMNKYQQKLDFTINQKIQEKEALLARIKELEDQQLVVSSGQQSATLKSKESLGESSFKDENNLIPKSVDNQYRRNLSLDNNTTDTQSLFYNRTVIHHQEQFKISQSPDLVFFYSDPLLCEEFDEIKQKITLISSENMKLSLDLEFSKLLQSIRDTDKEFKISKQPINFESFKTWMAKKPKALHISCHGDFDKIKKEFYLQFEGTGSKQQIGIDDRVHQSRLKQLLGEDGDHEIKLAFVSACFSEQIGKILLDCNIPFVICVNSSSKIADDICLLFSRHLYMHLLQGKSIRKAFEQAKSTCRGSDIKYSSCCCAHPHKPDCKWLKYKEKYGIHKAHQLHSGECGCDLGFAKHKSNCEVFLNFKKTMREFKDEDNRNQIESLQLKLPKSSLDKFNAFDEIDVDDAFNFESNIVAIDAREEDNIMCCCCDDIPHDESMKFVLLSKNPDLDLVIFNNRQIGNVGILNQASNNINLFNIYDDTILIGRNHEIQEIAHLLTIQNSNRSIIVQGGRGLGKKCCVTKAVQYCIERHYFKQGATSIDLGNQTNLKGFQNLLYKRLRLEIKCIEDFYQIIQDQDMILIINDCEQLIRECEDTFKIFLIELIKKTNYLKIVIILRENNSFELNGAKKVIVKPLQKMDAVRYFKSQDKDNQLPNEEILQKEDLFDYQLSNEQLMDIYKHWMNNPQSFKAIFEDMQQKQKQFYNEQKKSLMPKVGHVEIKQDFYQKLQNRFPHQVGLLFILCYAPAGLIFEDIEQAANTSSQINDDWEDFFEEIQIAGVDEQRRHYNIETQSYQVSARNANHTASSSLKLIYQVHDEDLGVCLYKVKKNERDFINEKFFASQSRQYKFVQFIKAFSKISRLLLQSIKNQWKTDFDINLLSAHIDSGLWSSSKYVTCNFFEDENDFAVTQNPNIKFDLYQENYLQTFNRDLLEQLFPTKQDQQKMNFSIQFFDEVWITFVSILVMLKREDEALYYIEQIKNAIIEYNMELIRTKLSMIQTSILIQKGLIDEAKKLIVQIEKYFKKCSFSSREGMAETLILKVLYEITEYYILSQETTSKESPSEQQYQQQYSIIKYQLPRSMSHFDKQQKQQLFTEDDAEKKRLKIMKLIQSASQSFEQINDKLGIARMSLIKSNFLFSINHLSDLNIKAILSDLEAAKDIFQDEFCMEHQVNCMIIIAKIKLQQQKLQEAKEVLHQSIYLAKNMRNQLQLKELTSMLDEVSYDILKKCNNLIVFLSSFPLIDEFEHTCIQNLDHEKQSIIQPLKRLGKEINIKVDILNKRQLKDVANNGCRILVINQIVHKNKNLCIESGNGEFIELDSNQLREILNVNNTNLNIDAVFINIPGGYEIANVFKELGVEQIFVYHPDSASNVQSEISICELMRYQTVQIIKMLIQQKTFNQAFNQVKHDIANNSKIQGYQNCLEWFSGKQENPGGKIFDQKSFDELQHLNDGEVEDQSNALGPTNIITHVHSIVGRKSHIYKIVQMLNQYKTRFVSIYGDKGIGKTSLAKEVGLHLNQRGDTPDGVYLLDFSSVTHQQHIIKLFQSNGIEFMLNNHIQKALYRRSKTTGTNESQKDYKFMLIYDNVEKFKENKSLFQWHVKKMVDTFKNIKLVFTSQTQIDFLKRSGAVHELKLEPLSQEFSLQLVKKFSLKPLEKHEKVIIDKIQSLLGNPQNLIMFATLLRIINTDKIQDSIKILTKDFSTTNDKEINILNKSFCCDYSHYEGQNDTNSHFDYSYRRQTKLSIEKSSTMNYDKLSAQGVDNNYKIQQMRDKIFPSRINNYFLYPQPEPLKSQFTIKQQPHVIYEKEREESKSNDYSFDGSHSSFKSDSEDIQTPDSIQRQAKFNKKLDNNQFRKINTQMDPKWNTNLGTSGIHHQIKNNYEPEFSNNVSADHLFNKVSQISIFCVFDETRQIEVLKNQYYEDIEMISSLNFQRLLQMEHDISRQYSQLQDFLSMKDFVIMTFIQKSQDLFKIFHDKKEEVIRDVNMKLLQSVGQEGFSIKRANSLNFRTQEWLNFKSITAIFPINQPQEEESLEESKNDEREIVIEEEKISSASSFKTSHYSVSRSQKFTLKKMATQRKR